MTQHNHPHLIHPQYRPDIDGLRALAILSVLVFHAFPEIIPGRYIGVDIFFVISGYLISTIIFSSLERDRFSLLEFYIRLENFLMENLGSTDKQQQTAIKLVTSGQKTAAEVARLFKIRRSTVTRLLDRKHEDYSSQPVTL